MRCNLEFGRIRLTYVGVSKKFAWKGKGRHQKKEKKIVEFSTKVGGWGQQWTDFPLTFFFFLKKNMSLNPLKLPKNHFKTNFFFLQFLVGGPSSAIIVVILEAQTSIEKNCL